MNNIAVKRRAFANAKIKMPWFVQWNMFKGIKPPDNEVKVIWKSSQQTGVPAPKPETEKDWYRYQRFLQKKGFEELGSGFFSTVMGHPRSNKVIKICHNPDAWPDYMVWANKKGYGGNLAPKLYSYKHHGSFYVAVMERMEDRIMDLDWKDDLRVISPLISYARHGNKKASQLADVLVPGFDGFFSEMLETFKEARIDLHDENIMVRKDGSFCVTDPLSSALKLQDKRLRGADLLPKVTLH